MSNIYFETTRINFRNSSFQNWGGVTAEGVVSFSSNVIQAIANIQAIELWRSSSSGTQKIGASIVNINWNGTKVSFTVSVDFSTTYANEPWGDYFKADHSYARIVVMAECE